MNLLVTGAYSNAKENIARLQEMGHNVRFMQYESDTLVCPYEWVEGVICNGLFLSHPIEKFRNLKYIQLTSAGFDRVPMDYVDKHGIKIFNARGVYSIPMAEFALTGVLELLKKMSFFYDNQKQHTWEKNRSCVELNGKHICIIGCGSVGTECAKLFKAFSCEVVGVDLYPSENSNYEKIYSLDEVDRVLPWADVVVLCVPLTEKTNHLINKEKFALLKDGAILVNISRGAIVDEKVLINSMDRLGGAVLDVFEEEPLDSESPLWDLENVLITPHNSFVGDGNQNRLTRVIFDNLAKT